MNKKILIVEDEPNILTSLRFLLERSGFEVEVESDGTTALELIFKSEPDVLVLDVMLPGIDGFEILRRIRAEPITSKLPVLMLTAKGQREDRNNAIELGADQFISKPFSNGDVMAAVKELSGAQDE